MGIWQKVSGKEVYRNTFYTVEEDVVIRPEGGEGLYSVVRKGPFCIIVAIEKDKIYFVKQFRYPTQQEGWELIKGGCDGEDILVAAKRELVEEAGLQANEMREIGAIEGASSFCDEIGHIVVAIGLKTVEGRDWSGEGISSCVSFSKSEYRSMIESKDIHDSHTLAALYLIEMKGII